MTFDYALITKYVEGKAKNKFEALYEHLGEFLEQTAAILSDVDRRVKLVRIIPWEKMKRDILAKSVRGNLSGARAGLTAYNRMFGRVDLYLGLMSSEFNLPRFLKTNGVPATELPLFKKLLRQDWRFTYGTHIERFRAIHPLLDRLRKSLEAQVRYLEKMEHDTLFDALDDKEALGPLFEEEKKAFWELYKTCQITVEEVSKPQAALQAETKRMREALAAYKRSLESGLEKDRKMAKRRVEEAFILLTYFTGIVGLVSGVPINLLKGAKGRIFGFLSNKILRGKKLSAEGIALQRQAFGFLGG